MSTPWLVPLRAVAVAVAVAVALGLLAGCSKTPTQIVVAVAVDPALKVPGDIDTLVVAVAQQGRAPQSRNLDLIQSPTLPATLAINAGRDPSIPVTVTAEATKKGVMVVEREARLGFVAGRAKLLRLELLRVCAWRSPACPDGASCVRGACFTTDVDAATLPDWSEEEAYRPIPSADAAGQDLHDRSRADRAPDSGPDRGTYPEVPGIWVRILKGTFTMGAPPTEAACSPPTSTTWGLETPHPVTLTHDYEMAATETTVQDFRSVFGKGDSTDCQGLRCAVTGVTWHDAAAYCNKLSEKMGLSPCFQCTGVVGEDSARCLLRTEYVTSLYSCPGFRLPTEAEWEYAYRAGTQTAFYSGPFELEPCVRTDAGAGGCQVSPNAGVIGWYCANTLGGVSEVGLKRPNSWGLYDLAGNVAEWTLDTHKSDLGTQPATDPVNLSGIDTVTHASTHRGGNFKAFADRLRAAARVSRQAESRGANIDRLGVRCVRVLP